MSENKIPILPWDIYNYAEIRLNNNQVFIVSSLLVYEFDKSVKFDGVRVKKRFYPWIS